MKLDKKLAIIGATSALAALAMLKQPDLAKPLVQAVIDLTRQPEATGTDSVG